ncbi:nitric oxide reductase activation protein NorD [Pseudoxanthomonas koreensis]|uniref:nitric oxide reductase activation protein NorD n=1 Tax=Pseudoxanthomonas koreensis TaxID=266061 RepID=UPI0035A6DFBA
MAEAEDLVVDAARHATVFIRDTWRRHYARAPDEPVALASLARRLDLLLSAACGTSLPMRVALPPARPTVLHRLFHAPAYPRHRQALPATSGDTIWLPAHLDTCDPVEAAELYRAIAMQQAHRAMRGHVQAIVQQRDPLLRDTALVLEAQAAEREVARRFPGLLPALRRLRRRALAARPPLHAFAPARQPLEQLVRAILERDLECEPEPAPRAARGAVDDPLAEAGRLLQDWNIGRAEIRRLGPMPLYRDWWTGELRATGGAAAHLVDGAPSDREQDDRPVRSARMERRPDEREATEDEDKPGEPGVWMIQQDAPHEVAEDPFGLQRPVDRDDETSADEYGDMLSELASTRMIAAPDPPREVLLSDDPPPTRAVLEFSGQDNGDARFRYPEWDHASASYIERGTTVRMLPPVPGNPAWVDATLARHRAHLDGIRRQFEALQPERVRLRRQNDGEDIDIDACVQGRADLRAGGFLREGLYEARRPGRRSIAVYLLVDASGSTDGFIGDGRRVIDVEREALLLVCMALQGLGEPFCVTAFSGEGPHGVRMRMLKDFDEAYGQEVALRIAGLEPENYTRAGAAIRHATALLMRQPAEHRLLLMLSDGKPNDADRYDGVFGVEDMRQSVTEARLQGIFPFCLTVDLQAPGYLPKVFGQGHYALLSAPERLPLVLLDWTRRLLAR